MPKLNPFTLIDAYKVGHIDQFPTDSEVIFVNLTPRSNKLAAKTNLDDDKVTFLGLKGFIVDLINDTFCNNTEEEFIKYIKEFQEITKEVLGIDSYPKHLEDLAYYVLANNTLPICIMALPEGTPVKPGIPVLTMFNTDKRFYWLPLFLESLLSNSLWKACTSATTARKYRQILEMYADATGVDSSFVDIQGHDFSFRGMSGISDACYSGIGHQLFFTGSDTIPVVSYIRRVYGSMAQVAGSIPATEHSVMCMGGLTDEFETFKRLITEVYPTGPVSIVSDTWDLWKVLTDYMPRLVDVIKNRPGKVVIRPDSGDPVDIICGDKNAPAGSPANKGVIRLLHETFGGTVNKKGFIELHPSVGAIYGDSITLSRAESILRQLTYAGFASSCIVFGIGSFTYEYVTRDTHGFAVKATGGVRNGEYVKLFKDPVTDSGMKKSLKGFLTVVKYDQDFVVKDQIPWNAMFYGDNCLKVVYPLMDEPNYTLNESFDILRERAKGYL